MVNLSRLLMREGRSIILAGDRVHAPHRYNNFVDSLRIYCKGGRGGTGFPRYGGVGGKGGDVYVIATENIKDLKSLRDKLALKRFVGTNGEDSKRSQIVGAPGVDTLVKCPLGVDVCTENGTVIGSIKEKGDKVLVSRGGMGGNRLNQFNGMEGEGKLINLDMKLLADIGLVGFPNAGKSSLLKGISRASPKIANYPFTTLNPNLGIIKYPDHRAISMADLPGLIEGAHVNKGLGHKFLKHIERTRLLLFVVDINGFQLGPWDALHSPQDTIQSLMKELSLYKETLMNKPRVLCISKMDTQPSDSKFQELLPEVEGSFDHVMPISSMSSYNMPQLKELLRDKLDAIAYEEEIVNQGVVSYESLMKQKKEKSIM